MPMGAHFFSQTPRTCPESQEPDSILGEIYLRIISVTFPTTFHAYDSAYQGPGASTLYLSLWSPSAAMNSRFGGITVLLARRGISGVFCTLKPHFWPNISPKSIKNSYPLIWTYPLNISVFRAKATVWSLNIKRRCHYCSIERRPH